MKRLPNIRQVVLTRENNPCNVYHLEFGIMSAMHCRRADCTK